MTKTSGLPSAAQWIQLFGALDARLEFPVAPAAQTDGATWLFRDMYIDLSDILQQVSGASTPPRVVQVYADVVNIADARAAVISDVVVLIFARLLRTDGAAQIVLDTQNGKLAQLTLFNAASNGNLSLIARTDVGDQTLALPSAGAAGVILKGTAKGAPQVIPLGGIDVWMQTPETPCQLLMAQTFAGATVLAESQPDVAADMLGWVRDVQSPAASLACQALQAVSMLVLLARGKDGAVYVPTLDKDVYVDELKTFVAAANSTDAAYQKVIDTNASLDARKAAAQLMLSHEVDTATFNQAMIDQAKNNLSAAQLSAATAAMNLQFQRDAVARAANRLNAGISAYEYEHKVQAAFEIVGAVVEFAGAIAEVSLGDEAAAPKAAEAAADAAKTAQSMADVMKAMSTVTQLLSKLYALAGQLAELGSSLDDLNKDQAAYQDVVTTAVTPADFATSTAQWGAFSLSAQAQLQPVIAAGVDGANEYLASLQTLALYGTSYVDAQQATVVAAQDLMRLALQAQIAEADVARISTYIDSMSAQETANAPLLSLLFGRLLDLRRSLIIATDNYRAAYCYWAMRQSSVTTTITDSVPTLVTGLSQVASDYGAALNSFSPPPAPWQQDLLLTDALPLATFKSTRKATWSLDLDDAQLEGLDRVRVNTVRIGLEGVTVPAGQSLGFVITTSGQYADRRGSSTFRFACSPLTRQFLWIPSTQQIIIDGTVSNDLQFAYFQPSAFTEWTIALVKPRTGVDLSGLTAVRVTFLGSAIPDLQTKRGLAAA